MRLRTPASRPGGDEGIALLAVLGTMAVLTMFLLTTLAYGMDNTPLSKRDQDGKAALAAAQAGIEDYLSRLNANGGYWQTTDTGNTAFSTGLPIAGTGNDKGSFTYTQLLTQQQVLDSGNLRLRVTGRSGDTERTLTATLSPVGFLKYVYYTDVEAIDPVLYSKDWPALVNGQAANGASKTYFADPATVNAMCSRYYYAGRTQTSYTATTATPYFEFNSSSGIYSSFADGKTVTLTNGCRNIQWVAGDVVDGPMHSNDALQINGAVLFKHPTTETSWSPTAPLQPVNPSQPWWGTSSPSSAGHMPYVAEVVGLPDNNAKLAEAAGPGQPGCLYTGATKITFVDNAMTVWSPNTTTAKPGCLNTANRANPQTITPIPPVIYVAASTGACSPVGYPYKGNNNTATHEAKLGATPDHDCTKGNAYVSGVLKGRTTVGTDNDIIITSNLTYKDGTNGTDVLGLIANNYVWVYKPVNSSGSNITTDAPAVYNIHAAILSVQHSFLVQSWNYGAMMNSGGQKLTVLGMIGQKFRGPVGTSTTGYLKNYIYDSRLLTIPPPYFLKPKTAPWQVTKTSG